MTLPFEQGLYEHSYPPSLFAPPPIPATGATAGIPGTWTPAGCAVPADLAAVISAGIVASPATAWTTGQYVQTGTVGVAGRVTWTGTNWVGGAAPLDVGTMTIDAVKAYVAANPDQLGAVYDAEMSGRARSSLLSWLNAERAAANG